MKILVISPHYFPRISPRAFRWKSICEELAKLGNDITVLTNSINGASKEEVIEGVTIYRRGLDLHKNGKRNDNRNSGNSNNMKKKIKKVYDLTWKKVYWPDNGIINYPSYKKEVSSLFRKKKYDLIIGVGLPFTSILNAYDAAEKYNLPFIIDIGDPFAHSYLNNQEINNTRLYKNINKRIEKKIFTRAKIVIVTNPNIKKLYELEYKLSNILLIPPIITKNKNVSSKENILKRNPRKINLVYIGSLNSEIRNPSTFLELIGNSPYKEGYKIHFIGNLNDCKEIVHSYKTKFEIEIYGQLTKEECDVAMEEADVLVNIGNNNKYQLPSKLIDYAFAKKKILHFSSIKADSSESFLEHYPYFYILKNKVNYEDLNIFLSNKQTNDELVISFLDKLSSSSNPKNAAENIMRILKEEKIKKFQ